MTEYPFFQKSTIPSKVGEQEIKTLVDYKDSLSYILKNKGYSINSDEKVAFKIEIKRINKFLTNYFINTINN